MLPGAPPGIPMGAPPLILSGAVEGLEELSDGGGEGGDAPAPGLALAGASELATAPVSDPESSPPHPATPTEKAANNATENSWRINHLQLESNPESRSACPE
jgi:hypothetical protein